MATKAAPTSRRPVDSDFYQQRLKAWQPILTPKWVIITFIIIGIPFIAIGFVLKAASDGVIEHRVQYDGAGTDAAVSAACGIVNGTMPKTCTVTIPVPVTMKAPVYVYYELTNFYQNHRRYVKSRYDAQLAGQVFVTDPSNSALNTACDPLSKDASGKVFHPCGLIANSYFNDTFTLASSSVSMEETGIAWASDLKYKFKDPSPADMARIGEVHFINETYPAVQSLTDEHFVVWMRPAALPTFRKLYGRITSDVAGGSTLSFTVAANFPVSSYEGTKAIIVSTTSFMGGKNPFLGVAYIVVGFLCLGAALAFGIRQFFGGRKLGEASFLAYSSS